MQERPDFITGEYEKLAVIGIEHMGTLRNKNMYQTINILLHTSTIHRMRFEDNWERRGL